MHNSILPFFWFCLCQFTACTPLVRGSLYHGRPMRNLLWACPCLCAQS